MTTDRLLLADPPTGRISTICNLRVLLSVGPLCYHNDGIEQEDKYTSLDMNVGIVLLNGTIYKNCEWMNSIAFNVAEYS
jgi:hypothetical protein